MKLEIVSIEQAIEECPELFPGLKQQALSPRNRRDALALVGTWLLAAFCPMIISPTPAKAGLYDRAFVALERIGAAKIAWDLGSSIYGYIVGANNSTKPAEGDVLVELAVGGIQGTSARVSVPGASPGSTFTIRYETAETTSQGAGYVRAASAINSVQCPIRVV